MSQYDDHANDVGIAFITQVFRLIRSAQMHEISSLLSQGTLATGAEALSDMARGNGGFVVVMFAGETVFANGQPLRATKLVYDNVLEVGATLDAVGYNELTIRVGVTATDLSELLTFLVKTKRAMHLPRTISLQAVDPASILGEIESDLTVVEQVAAAYGAAVVLVRRCNALLMQDDQKLMRHVKRVCQRLVSLTRKGFVELLALARRPAAPTDHAAIAVNAAVIGALAGRALTTDTHTLLRIVMGALQAEIGKPRVAGMYRSDGFQMTFVPHLNQTMRRRVPASTAVVLLEAGRAAEQPMKRAVVAYEAAHLADGELLGWPYEGKVPPTVESVLASLACRVSSAMANSSGPDDMIDQLAQFDLGKVERAGLDLIYSVLGVVPKGTPVALTNGWKGVVLSSGKRFSELERCEVVRLIGPFGRPAEPQIVTASENNGWVRSVITDPDPVLAQGYEKYAASTSVRSEQAPVTGVLGPEVGDSIADRDSLHFDSEAAYEAADAMLTIERGDGPRGPRGPAPPPYQQDSGTAFGLPGQFADPSGAQGRREAPRQFGSSRDDQDASGRGHASTVSDPPSSVPRQFGGQDSPSVPSQFGSKPTSSSRAGQFAASSTQRPGQFASEPPASQHAAEPSGPKQFASDASSRRGTGLPSQFATPPAGEVPSQFGGGSTGSNRPSQFAKSEPPQPAEEPAPKTNVPGAWVKPRKAAPAEEPKKDTKDDDDDDGDGGPSNLLLFD